VADENAPAAFELAGRAVELGYDLRAVCRELARMSRDLLVLSVDPARINDPEIAGENERDRLLELTKRFSREDLLRAFDVLTRAEYEIRSASQPRYHLEMALLRWIHLRKLVSIEDLIAGGSAPARVATAPASAPARTPTPVRAATISTSAPSATVDKSGPPSASPAVAASKPAPVRGATLSGSPSAPPGEPAQSATAGKPPAGDASFKDAFLAEIRKNKMAFYSMVVAQARTIEIVGNRVEFAFSANQRALREQVEQNKAWLESMALQSGGRKVTVTASQDASVAAPAGQDASAAAGEAAANDRKAELKQQALADKGVQAMLEVFPAEIRDVEEM